MKLFVANLPFSVSEDDLTKAFEAAGFSPTQVNLILDRDTGSSRGFAFVTFRDRESGEDAMNALQGVKIGGRSVFIQEAKGEKRKVA